MFLNILNPHLFDPIVHILEQMSYFGVFLGMFLESLNVPIPSEIVMSLAAHFVINNGANLPLIILSAVAGNAIGSSIIYWVGRLGGEALLKRDFKFINLEKVRRLEAWMAQYGLVALFFATILPIVRSVAPLPAGLLKIDYKKFLVVNLIGITIWCTVLIYAAMGLLNYWEELQTKIHLPVLIGIVVGLVIVIFGVKFYLEKRLLESTDK